MNNYIEQIKELMTQLSCDELKIVENALNEQYAIQEDFEYERDLQESESWKDTMDHLNRTFYNS
jgi:hypothetical protein